MKKLSKPFESLNVIRIVMGLVGGLPPTILTYNHSKWDNLYLIYSLFIIIVFGVLFVLSQFISLLFIKDDIQLLADSSYLMLEQIGFCIKAFILLKNWKKVSMIFEKLRSPEMNQHSLDQDYIVQESMWIVKRNSMVNQGLITISVLTIFNAPLALGYKDLILAGWYPFNINSTTNFVLTYAWQEIGLLLCGNLNGSIDILFANLLVLACGQFNVLSNSLENIRKNAITRLDRKKIYCTKSINTKSAINNIEINGKYGITLDKEIYQEIIRCVRHHYEILNLVDMIEDSFLSVVFVQFAASVLVLCVTTFEISLLEINNPNLIGVIMFQICMLQQLFLYCWYGNEIYFSSLNLFDATYTSKWNKFDTKCRQAIAIILDRTKFSILLKAGNFVPLKLETFIAILRLSYSFYTLLQGARKDEDF